MGLPVQNPQGLHHRLRRQPALAQTNELIRRQRQQLVTPDVLHHLLQQVGGVGLQLRIHGSPAAEGHPPQRAAAEAMNRGDIGPIELFQRKKQAADPLPAKRGVCRMLQPVLKNRIGSWRSSLSLERFQAFEGSLEALADA